MSLLLMKSKSEHVGLYQTVRPLRNPQEHRNGRRGFTAFGVVAVAVASFWSAVLVPVPVHAHVQVMSVPQASLRAYGGVLAGNPTRLVDTRPGGETIDGRFRRDGKVGAGATYAFVYNGRGQPSANLDAMLNITITEPEAAGFVTLYPCAAPRPNTSVLNFETGQTVANFALFTVELATQTDKRACLFVSARTHVIVDFSGELDTESAEVAAFTTSYRMLDTRPGAETFDGLFRGAGRVAANAEVKVKVTGRKNTLNQDVVGANDLAVALNVTVVDPTGAGFVTVYPCGSVRPNTSTLNFVAGQTVANFTLMKVGTNGEVCYFADQSTHVLVDLVGHGGIAYPGSDLGDVAFVAPKRVLDTRASPTIDGKFSNGGRVVANDTLRLDLTRRAGVPSEAGVAFLNVTVVDPNAGGFVTVYPCGSPQPNASNINFAAGRNVANFVVVKLDATGQACLFTSAATHLLADLVAFGTPQVGRGPQIGAKDSTCAIHTPFQLTIVVRLWCWGFNTKGQLGIGTTTNNPTPTGVRTEVRSVSVGAGHTCAVSEAFNVFCWGRNSNGQLGDTTTNQRSTPGNPIIPSLLNNEPAVDVSAGFDHTCILTVAKHVYCMGSNVAGQLGVAPPQTGSTHPILVMENGAALRAVAISAGLDETCVVREDRSVACWGYPSGINKGTGITVPVVQEYIPRTITGVDPDTLSSARQPIFATEVRTFGDTACALSLTKAVLCWGKLPVGTGGAPTAILVDPAVAGSPSLPLRAASLSGIGLGPGTLGPSASPGFGCANSLASVVHCWGDIPFGSLGSTVTAKPIPGFDSAIEAAVGYRHVCIRRTALGNNVTIRCVGNNTSGQLGDGTLTARDTPISVAFPSEPPPPVLP